MCYAKIIFTRQLKLRLLHHQLVHWTATTATVIIPTATLIVFVTLAGQVVRLRNHLSTTVLQVCYVKIKFTQRLKLRLLQLKLAHWTAITDTVTSPTDILTVFARLDGQVLSEISLLVWKALFLGSLCHIRITTTAATTTTPPACTLDCGNGFCKFENGHQICECNHGFGGRQCQQVRQLLNFFHEFC